MPDRREFLEALGLAPFAIAATASAAKKKPAPSPSPTATPPEDPYAKLKAFHVDDSAEPATVFSAAPGKR